MGIGDIYTVDILHSNGHEQAGTRPAIIVQAPEFKHRLPTVLIVPLTSQMAAQGFPGTFLIDPDSENNLATQSVALVLQLRATDKRRLGHLVGHLSASYLAALQRHMRSLLQLP